MGLEKLMKKVQACLDASGRKKKVRCESIEELLEKLKGKEEKLKKKLAKEKNSGKRKQLKLELKIIAVQIKKGQAYLDDHS